MTRRAVINTVANEMLAASCADHGRHLAQGVAILDRPGFWAIELEQSVFDALLRLAPPDLSDAVIKLCGRQP